MRIVLDHNYHAIVDDKLLGYVGETQSRTMIFGGLAVDGADSYSIVFDYGDGTAYEVPITSGTYTIAASILRRSGKVRCQVFAKKAEGDVYKLIKKSNIFDLEVGDTIAGDTTIPTKEEALSVLDKINQQYDMDAKLAAAQEAAATAQTIAADLSQKDFVLKLNADSSVTLVFNSERG